MTTFAHTAPAVATERLSADRQAALIAAAQDVSVEVVTETRTDADGTEREVERTVYGRTSASDAALEELTLAFMPAIRRAAGSAGAAIEEGDAFGVALETFVAAVRDHDLTSELPFAATIATILSRSIRDTVRTSDVVSVRENVAANYWRLVHKHAGDVRAAYEECRTTSNNLAADTFLAAHRAIGGAESLDAPAGREDDGAAREGFLADRAPSPEDVVANRDLVRWLFTLVDDRQEGILRLRFGFDDLATENSRLAHGYRVGEVLSDVQVAGVLGLTRPTVQREKTKALRTMRAALEGLDEDGAGAA